MENQKSVLFIINPNSGKRDGEKVLGVIPKHLDLNKFSYEAKLTEYPRHATEIAKKAAMEGVDIVVAVGGDGIINEVFQALVGTSTALGILPKGSGNGIARTFGIPMRLSSSIAKLNTASFHTIDTCVFNKKPFLGIAGVGFDGLISKKFSKTKERGLKTYAKLVVKKALGYKPKCYTLKLENNVVEAEALIVAFANTQQYGNNAVVAPEAKLDDGQMKVVVFRACPVWYIPALLVRMLTNTTHKSSYVDTYSATEVEINSPTKRAHIDGEPIKAKAKNTIRVVPRSLKAFY